MNHNIGDLVYVRINVGRGITLAKLVSRHDPEHWDCDLYPNTSGERLIVVGDEDVLNYDPYEESERLES